MTVLLVNGSPHEHGCTDAALKHAASVLEEQGVHTEIFWIGSNCFLQWWMQGSQGGSRMQ